MTTKKRLTFFVILAVVSFAGMNALWRSTPYGLGLVNDSATYVEGATNLLASKGYVRISGGGEIKPITHFPPLFSLVLAGLGLVGADLIPGARVLITLLFGVDIFLVGLSVFKISRSVVFSCLGALLLAFSDVHLGVYSLALSEPLFITLMLAAFLCFAESFDHPGWTWQVLTGLLLGLAYLARFAGASLLFTAALCFFLIRPSKMWKRIGLMALGASIPVLAWLGYSLAQAGAESIGNRQVLWHPLSLPAFFEMLKNLLTWIAPDDLLAASPLWGRLLSGLSLLLLPGLLTWLVWVWLHRLKTSVDEEKPGGDLALATILGVHVLVYLAFLVLTLTFFDASTPLDDRILSVIYIPELILFAIGLAWLWHQVGGRAAVMRWAIAIFSLVLVFFSIKDGVAAVNQLGREGQGFAHREISGSPAVQTLRNLPPTVIYSNKPGAIFLLTGKHAYVAPTPIDPVTEQSRPGYQDDLENMQQRVRDGEAILVLFGLHNSQEPGEADLYTALSGGLNLLYDYGEIRIFGASR